MNGRIVSGGPEEITVAGTAIAHLPLDGRPEFAGLEVADDGSAVARIDDGPLHLEVGDLATALAWLNASTRAVELFRVRTACAKTHEHIDEDAAEAAS